MRSKTVTATAPPVPHNPFPGATVLIVDDVPESLDLLVDALSSEGIRVLIATGGNSAIEVLNYALPGLILMDAMMPGMDGFATTRLIKIDARYAHLPIIFMSGLTESNNVVRGLEAGGIDFISKPLILDQLIARLRVHLRNARVLQVSQTALDLMGRPVIALDDECRVSWSTPLGDAMAASLFPGFARSRTLPDHVKLALRRFRGSRPPAKATARIDLDDGWATFTFMGHNFSGERLFLISKASDGWEQRMLASQHMLTVREAEVLVLISRGKSNREISDSLLISTRTVSKHLEQIFKKLRVQNRSSAAARAVETLSL